MSVDLVGTNGSMRAIQTIVSAMRIKRDIKLWNSILLTEENFYMYIGHTCILVKHEKYRTSGRRIFSVHMVYTSLTYFTKCLQELSCFLYYNLWMALNIHLLLEYLQRFNLKKSGMSKVYNYKYKRKKHNQIK